MAQLPNPPAPVLERAARELAEATMSHPRIYELPPEQGREVLAGLQSGEGVEKPEVEQDWVTVRGGPTGSVRRLLVTDSQRGR